MTNTNMQSNVWFLLEVSVYRITVFYSIMRLRICCCDWILYRQ